MNDEELLQALAQVSREEFAAERSLLDRRWDALSAGELSAEEERELQELAAASPEHARALEAFSPLGEEFRARTASLLEARLNAVGQTDPLSTRSRRQTTGDRWPWARLRLGWLLPAAAFAALLWLVVLPLETPQPIPEYTAELHGGISELRGADAATVEELPVLATGSSIDLILRPQSAVDGSLVLRCFLVHEGTVREQALPARIADSGTVRVEAELGRDLDLEPGVWSLVTVVAYRGREPGPDQLAALALQEQPQRADHWAVNRVSFRVRDAPSSSAPAGV